LALTVGWIRRKPGGRRGITVPAIVAATGFAGMLNDLMIVFVVQALHGYVYQHIGLIIAAFMAGLALGGWTMSHIALGTRSAPRDRRRLLVLSEVALIAYWLVLPLLLIALSSSPSALLVTPVLLFVNALGGWLVGLQFPLSSQLHLSARGEPAYTAGVLYAADLAGAFLGALAVGIALLPVLGSTGTCLFVVVLKVCSLLLVLTTPRLHAPQMPAIG
jgi:spermidine synthase